MYNSILEYIMTHMAYNNKLNTLYTWVSLIYTAQIFMILLPCFLYAISCILWHDKLNLKVQM